ncbi:MAG: hypothetical protein UR13_C0008G0043 [Candidatus Woesebacteria bacterium GW2011_GWD1_31_12]|nr:MAG: hypothetical protein UR13_C0008G0043 [Candidatus Woesebacteria bacterium GW2011_GWD1_31_12]
MVFLFNLLSFLIPTQLGFHLNFLTSTVFGFKIDYLIPTIYLTDIIIFLLLFFNIKKIKFKLFTTLLFVSFIIINVLVSQYKIPSIYKWIKVSEMILLGLLIIKSKNFKVFDNFIKPLSYSIFIACFLGVAQWLLGKTIGGPFYFLGERSFRLGDPGISAFNMLGTEMLRPYAFFSHPNSFAGFLLVFSIFFIKFKNLFNKKYFYILSILIITNLLLTFSLNVFLTIFILILIYVNPYLNYTFLFIDFGSRTFSHRIELLKSSLHLIKQNFFVGVGLNNFIPNLVKVSNGFLNSWELQPVHNIYLLIFSETGIIGLMLFVYLLIRSFIFSKGIKVYIFSLYAILITGLSDHYWITLQQNILLFTFVLALSLTSKKK